MGEGQPRVQGLRGSKRHNRKAQPDEEALGQAVLVQGVRLKGPVHCRCSEAEENPQDAEAHWKTAP